MKLFSKIFSNLSNYSSYENSQTEENAVSTTDNEQSKTIVKTKNMMLVDAYWNGSLDSVLVSELDNLLQDCSARSEELVKIAELCLPATTNEQLYYASKAYVWAGASCRKDAIYYLEKYIASGATYDGTPSDIREINGVVYDLKTMSISNTYSDLAKCYEGEYEFDKAIENYEKAMTLSPHMQSYVISLANVYVKKNQLEKAKNVLESATSSEAYKDAGFRTAIDKNLLDINEKITRGYVYKPRKKK